MAAVLTPQAIDPRVLTPRPHRRGVAVGGPQLRLVEGGRSGRGSVYLRRRIVAGLLAVVAVAALGWLAAWTWTGLTTTEAVPPTVAGSPVAAGAAGGGAVHVVQPGDTLWSVANELDPDGDPRPLVDELADRAGGAELQPGQRIPLDGLVG